MARPRDTKSATKTGKGHENSASIIGVRQVHSRTPARGTLSPEQIQALARPDFITQTSPIHKNPTLPPATDETFTGLEAAKIVLADADQPLHYNELTRQILEQGLWTTTGQTPAATINALITGDIKKHGELSDFRRTQPGHYYLNIDGLESPSHTEFLETKPFEEIPPRSTSNPPRSASNPPRSTSIAGLNV